MKTVKQLVQGMVVAIGVIGLAAAVSAAPKSISKCQTIDEPGSYLVTKNLTTNGHCLLVTADDVTIDLGGYVLSGNGVGYGVHANSNYNGVTVRNGTVRGFEYGVALWGDDGIVDQVRARDNDTVGISVGTGYAVKASVANNNGFKGIELQCPASAVGNTALANPGSNLNTVGAGCFLSQNHAP